MLLGNKNAVIYGGGGSIGGAVAREFSGEGARVFLVGRTRESLETVANDITADGGAAEVAVLDALDEQAVDEHAQAVISQAGSIDISFNLITRGDAQGIPLIDMATDELLRAVVNGLRSNFLTARAAARRMVEQGSGVILALDSGSAKGSPMMGSTGPADAAIDTFIRNRDRTPRRARSWHLDSRTPRDVFAGEARRGRQQIPRRGSLPGRDREPGSDADDAALTPAGRSRSYGGVPGLREGRRYHQHVRQRHQRDVPQLVRGKGWQP
jgi:hypothetical protein